MYVWIRNCLLEANSLILLGGNKDLDCGGGQGKRELGEYEKEVTSNLHVGKKMKVEKP